MAACRQLEASGDERTAASPARSPAPDPTNGRYRSGSILCGKYRLDALVGEGAMGAVWRATNLVLESPVAIKLIHAELDGGEFRERLQLEARAAAGLGHPAIVRVFDVGETDLGDPFIVMELLEGVTLAQMLKRGRLPATRAVQIVLPIVDALAAMHARGVVHRDLKPDNLLVSSEDQRVQPKVLDFGVAKLNTPRGQDFKFDDGGRLVGSPEYMSPEQWSACGDIDYRTDIWSICVVLYEAVTGETPFGAPNNAALLRAIVEKEPASLTELTGGDERLWEILRVGLAKDRLARHESMSHLGRALAAWLLGKGVHEDVCGASLESKWFGEAAESSSVTIASARVERRHTSRAAAACTLLAAVALAFSLVASKRSSADTSEAAAHAEPSREAPVGVLVREEAAPAPAENHAEAVVTPVRTIPEPLPATRRPTATASRQNSVPNPGPTKEVQKAQVGLSGTSFTRATASRTSGADLDLIAPY
jgi:serine/threonine-protein kinase